jgi:hypothetical protein
LLAYALDVEEDSLSDVFVLDEGAAGVAPKSP